RMLAFVRRVRSRIPARSGCPKRIGARTARGVALMMRSLGFRVLAASLLLACTALAGHAEYPDRPLKIIVAWPPGGIVDATARVIGEQLAMQLRQPVVVENRVGANGNIGTTSVARAPAD